MHVELVAETNDNYQASNQNINLDNIVKEEYKEYKEYKEYEEFESYLECNDGNYANDENSEGGTDDISMGEDNRVGANTKQNFASPNSAPGAKCSNVKVIKTPPKPAQQLQHSTPVKTPHASYPPLISADMERAARRQRYCEIKRDFAPHSSFLGSLV